MTASRISHAGKWIGAAAASLIVAAVAVLAGLVVLGTASRPDMLTSVSDPMRHMDFSALPKLQQFRARDGQALSYRVYPGAGTNAVILIHGSSGESSGMHAVATAMNATGDTIFVPDLRGHGHDGRTGDIDYIGQLDDDLADLVGVVRSLHAAGDLILVGHSSGGGFVLRIAVGPYAHLFSRFVLLSPAMPYGAVTYRPHVGGWATPFVGRIIALKILNRVGVSWFNGLPVVAFAVDPHPAVPLDTAYSYRMVADFGAPRDALEQLAAVRQTLAIVIGADDELFYADRYGPMIHAVRPDVPVTLVAGVNHMGMVTDPRALDAGVSAIR